MYVCLYVCISARLKFQKVTNEFRRMWAWPKNMEKERPTRIRSKAYGEI